MAMASGAGNQVMMDTATHLVMAQPYQHQNRLLLGMRMAFDNHVCQSVVWQNAI
jgi:hypothetical protein